MTRSFRWSRKVVVAGLLPLLAIGCSKSTETEQVNPPRVIVTGQFAIVAGASAQLTATTANGSDAGYVWATSDATVATVSSAGLVRGRLPGSATITATGTTTGLVGSYNVVVATSIPQQTAWLESGHADVTAPAFTYSSWINSGSVASSCARCHSSGGFRDYLGDDGSTPFKVDAAAPAGMGITCDACHNATAQTLSQVTFPYPSSRPATKITLTGLGAESRCMTCHQGRESTSTVNAAIEAAFESAFASTNYSAMDPDAVNTYLGFKNVHYFAAGATLNGGRVGVGYQYADKVYDVRFRHVPEKDSCIECHDPHSLRIDLASCATCHAGVSTAADLHAIRYKSSMAVDYDGDGNKTEGVAEEIEGLRDSLYLAIQEYATSVGTTASALCYSAASHPYWFVDPNGDGDCADKGASWSRWTPRLVRATFNYQFSLKDPGAFAHNAKYVLQLLFDALEDVNAALAADRRIDMTAMRRDDVGHFHGSGEPARHWDEDGEVEHDCSKCHSGSEGFRFYVTHGIAQTVAETGNGLDCLTCHTQLPASPAAPNLVPVASVTFPGGAVVEPDDASVPLESRLSGSSFICMTCHSNREGKGTVDASTGMSGDPDVINTAISFKNSHYLGAGSFLLGSEAGVGYEYPSKTYVGRDSHPLGIDCNACHSGSGTKHTFHVADNLAACFGCHGVPGPTSVEELRGSIFAPDTTDYDGDTVVEPLGAELDGIAARLLAAMQTYAIAHGGKICFGDYPYWLKADASGICLTGRSNAYKNWTPSLARAAFNYQFVHTDPGAWAHNMTYATQLLFDSIEDLGGNTTGLVRP